MAQGNKAASDAAAGPALASSDAAASDAGSIAGKGPFETQCGATLPEGCLERALEIAIPGTSPMDSERLKFAKSECDGGSALGCVAFGAMVMTRSAATPTSSDALAAFERACRLGDGLANAVACGRAADMVARGLGGPHDALHAASLLGRACDVSASSRDGGASPAPCGSCANLAAIFQAGRGLLAERNNGFASMLRKHGCDKPTPTTSGPNIPPRPPAAH